MSSGVDDIDIITPPMPADLKPGGSIDGFHYKCAIILHQGDYSELRKVRGFEQLTDIAIAPSDATKAKEAAKRMGVPPEEIYELTGTDNMKAVEILFAKITSTCMALGLEGKRSFVFVYTTGYGVNDGQQFFMVNSAKNNKFPVEEHARSISKLSDGFCFTMCVYDTCSSNENLGSRGGNEPADNLASGADMNYFSISNVLPKDAPAEAKLAHTYFAHLIVKSDDRTTYKGFVNIDYDLIEFKGSDGEALKVTFGNSFYLQY